MTIEIRGAIQSGNEMNDQAEASVHLSEGQLAGFLDHDLDRGERERVEAHLDQCEACRDELVGAGRLRDSFAPSLARSVWRRRATRWTAIGGAIAASLVGMLFLRQRDALSPVAVAERARALPERRASIDVVAPANDDIEHSAAIAFTWRSAAVSIYRFTLLSESGEPLFTAETTDTTVAWPASLKAAAGTVYFWRVDGIAGGISSSTGAQRLRLVP